MNWIGGQTLNEEDLAAHASAWEDGERMCPQSLPLLQRVYRKTGILYRKMALKYILQPHR